MAISSLSYFSTRTAPIPTLAGRFNKYDVGTTCKYPIGFKVETSDGSVYRYVNYTASAVTAGRLVSQTISEVTCVESLNAMVLPASSVSTTDGSIGTRFIELTKATVTANQYAGGKIILTGGTGAGFTYDVKGNTATDNPATGNIRIELYQPLKVAISTDTDFNLVGNPYQDLIIADVSTNRLVVGVVCATTTSTNIFGWIQTKGIVGILTDASVPAIGNAVSQSKLTNGCVGILGGTSASATTYGLDPIIGFTVVAGLSGSIGSYKINLE